MGVKISELTSMGTLAGTEKIPGVDSGTQYTTPADLKTYMQGNLSLITSGTAQATTSGTSKDFTSIPSTVKRITIMFEGVSTNGTSHPMIQIGDSGGVETSGYSGTASRGAAFANLSTGFEIDNGGDASYAIHGVMILALIDSITNTWACSSVIGLTGSAFTGITGGSKSLSATLDRVRLTTVSGADTFDAGKVNILYE